jgi:hypothetical protein
VVWEQTNGPLNSGVTVAACPVDPRCVRLDHLSLGRKQRTPSVPEEPAGRRQARRGSGSMRQLRPGVWELAVSAGGTRHYRTIRGTEHDAAFALAGFAADITGGSDTVEALVAVYIAHLETQGRSAATLHRYRQLWRQWLSPTLGARPTDGLTRYELEQTLTAMATAGQSHSSIHQAAVLLSGALAWGKRHEYLDHNPAPGLRLPNGTSLGPPRHR